MEGQLEGLVLTLAQPASRLVDLFTTVALDEVVVFVPALSSTEIADRYTSSQ